MRSLYAQLVNAKSEFFKLEAAGGILLVLAAVIALIIANSPWSFLYNHVLNEVHFGYNVALFDLHLDKSVLHWINDGLMVIFFFLVGLEIKRELIKGQLSRFDKAILPVLAAIGGMVVPAAIFWFINKDTPETLPGWAIPSATDIAFALGVLALLGSRIPLGLKVLLTAIAVIDDLGAIVVIALFYSHGLNIVSLVVAAWALAVLFVLNRKNVTNISAYILFAVILWLGVMESGVHATIAGVVAALFIPLRSQKDPSYSPLMILEHRLHPWIVYGVLPVFAFANAGVSFAGLTLHSLLDPVTLGIASGLFFGKQIGIFLVFLLVIGLKISSKPADVTWKQLYGVSILCGIGFTMSLFIGGLSYQDAFLQAEVRLGVMTGSVLSAIVGYIFLRLCSPPMKH